MIAIATVDRSERLKTATGAVFYGTDSAQWPAIWADVVLVANHQRKIYDLELADAERKETNGGN
jgi:hypothetical protein